MQLRWSDGHVSPYSFTWLLNRSFRPVNWRQVVSWFSVTMSQDKSSICVSESRTVNLFNKKNWFVTISVQMNVSIYHTVKYRFLLLSCWGQTAGKCSIRVHVVMLTQSYREPAALSLKKKQYYYIDNFSPRHRPEKIQSKLASYQAEVSRSYSVIVTLHFFLSTWLSAVRDSATLSWAALSFNSVVGSFYGSQLRL